jgi:CRP/FNR family transcriptional regulator, cyclic AMP receptor protein
VSSALDAIDLLGEWTQADRATLLEFLEPRDLDEGRALFCSGEESAELYFLIDGVLRLEVAPGRETGSLGAGEVLGSMSLVGMGDHVCTARAVRTSHVLVLSRESYLRLRSDHPAVALQLQEGIVRRLAADLRRALAAA